MRPPLPPSLPAFVCLSVCLSAHLPFGKEKKWSTSLTPPDADADAESKPERSVYAECGFHRRFLREKTRFGETDSLAAANGGVYDFGE